MPVQVPPLCRPPAGPAARRWLATVMTTALVLGVAPAAWSQPAGAGSRPADALRARSEPLDGDGAEVRGRPWPRRVVPLLSVPDPRWPASGSGRAVLPAAAARRTVAATVRAGNLPVEIAAGT